MSNKLQQESIDILNQVKNDLSEIIAGVKSTDELVIIAKKILSLSTQECVDYLNKAKDALEDKVHDISMRSLSLREFERHDWYTIIFDIADAHTPTDFYKIEIAYFLNSYELDEIFNHTGLYDTRPLNYKQIAICLWIEHKLTEHFYALRDKKYNK